ncbi:unnamed protein product [Periconia digitata]|uniref:RRM domain-containing protein n=1 Tax=Periconia digitata TaxID=1303443 RepID=A0A9W4XGS9_9PLEO|nr:unnamed protein product [Periconia digitata]
MHGPLITSGDRDHTAAAISFHLIHLPLLKLPHHLLHHHSSQPEDRRHPQHCALSLSPLQLSPFSLQGSSSGPRPLFDPIPLHPASPSFTQPGKTKPRRSRDPASATALGPPGLYTRVLASSSHEQACRDEVGFHLGNSTAVLRSTRYEKSHSRPRIPLHLVRRPEHNFRAATFKMSSFHEMDEMDEIDQLTASMPSGTGTGDYGIGAAATSKKRKDTSNDTNPKKQPKIEKEKKAPENRAIYVTNIPLDATADELADVFKKYGMIDQGVDGTPRVKLYTNDSGDFTGEALIVYFKRASVDLAIQLHDNYELRLGDTKNGTLSVQEADNTRRKNTDSEKIAGKLVRKERKTAERTRAEMQRKLAEWSDNEEEAEKAYAPKKNKWAKMCIIKKVFELHQLEEDDAAILEIKQDMREAAEKHGEVTKVVLYDEEPEGIVSVRFKDFEAAESFRAAFNGRRYNNQGLQISIAEDRPKFKKSRNGGGDDSEDDVQKMRRFLRDGDEDDSDA